MSTIDFKNFRKRSISAVLSTDINIHSKLIDNMIFKYALDPSDEGNKKLFNFENYLLINKESSKFEIQQDFINFIVHTSDINNPTKQFMLFKKWTELLYEEFFNQGDLEKQIGLPISAMCDRDKTNITESQINFITGITLPAFELLETILPNVLKCVEQIKLNQEELKKRILV